MRILSVLVFLILVTVACGGSGSGTEQSGDAQSSEPQSSESQSASADSAPPTEAPVAESSAPVPTAIPEPPPTTEPDPTIEPTPEPVPTSTPVPTPSLQPAERGPFGVGLETIEIASNSDRPLTVDVWFPVASDTSAPAARYTFVTGDFFEASHALAVDRASMSPQGPFPLVVYSHGSGGLRYIHSDYTEFLASHGYVIAAPDHTGNTSVDRFLNNEDDRDVIAINRPADVATVIDAFTDAGDPATTGFIEAVNGEQVAVTGHSFGGFTAYASVAGYENSVGVIPADERIDAIVPLAPAVGAATGSTLLSDDDLARVQVPALVIVGSDDKTTPVVPNVERAWELTTSSPHYRLELVAAEHQSFTDVCDYLAAAEAGKEISAPVLQTLAEFGEAGCSPGDMPIARVQELTNTFVLAFLESVFDGRDMISADDVVGIEDIAYLTKD